MSNQTSQARTLPETMAVFKEADEPLIHDECKIRVHHRKEVDFFNSVKHGAVHTAEDYDCVAEFTFDMVNGAFQIEAPFMDVFFFTNNVEESWASKPQDIIAEMQGQDIMTYINYKDTVGMKMTPLVKEARSTSVGDIYEVIYPWGDSSLYIVNHSGWKTVL